MTEQIHNKQHLEKKWNGFSRKVLHPDAPRIQHAEMRLAFFAGAVEMMKLLNEWGDLSDEQLEQKNVELLDEIDIWYLQSMVRLERDWITPKGKKHDS